MQDDQTTKAVDDLIKQVENSGSDQTGPTLADNPAEKAAQAEPAAENTPADESTSAAAPADNSSVPPAETPPSTPASGDDSLDPIKKEALQKLEPLVGELDLNPEEKYRALMMIIQATDNKELIAEAYLTADKIEDSKVRAQALLSIINEIDYFKNKESVSS